MMVLKRPTYILTDDLLGRLEKMEYLYNIVKNDMIELDSQIIQVTGRLMLLYVHRANKIMDNSHKSVKF